ncbi:MAG TPA: glycoside hydrolase family 3 protein [Clostridia bacterium]
MKRLLSIFVSLILIFGLLGCYQPVSEDYLDSSLSIEERIENLLGQMTLDEKVGQMVQGDQSKVTAAQMKRLGLGSILSGGGSIPNNDNSISSWVGAVEKYQQAAMSRRLKIPFIYGIDAVHGHNTVTGAVIFPHNIGIGAANDPELTEQMGAYVAQELKLTKTIFNFAPCVAVGQDLRWGRTYESYSSDPDIVTNLALSFMKGQQKEGILNSLKHYVGDGGTEYGTGRDGMIDRGDVVLEEQELREVHLKPYIELIENGARCVMASFNSYKGLKMHQHKYLITDILKGELGFDGFVISDWEGILEINKNTYDEKIIEGINAGLDMLMEPYSYEEAIKAIKRGVKSGAISKERINDAVSRILRVKFELGLFEDPYLQNIEVDISELGSAQGRELAKQLVQKSQVLLKNNNNVLPFKSGQKIFVTGPAADDLGVQCGGWTINWSGFTGYPLTKGTTILQGLKNIAGKHNLTIITDENNADEADVVLLVIGEQPYAEFTGDTPDPSIVGDKALSGNLDAIDFAKSLNKPIVTLIVAGRNVLIVDYIDDWDAVVMSYLPGSEGEGVASVLAGEVGFSGKLPMPYYKTVNDIKSDNPQLLFNIGDGLTTQTTSSN